MRNRTLKGIGGICPGKACTIKPLRAPVSDQESHWNQNSQLTPEIASVVEISSYKFEKCCPIEAETDHNIQTYLLVKYEHLSNMSTEQKVFFVLLSKI